MHDLTTLFAIPLPDGTVRVVGNRSRGQPDPIAPLTVKQFVELSAANWITWSESHDGMLTVAVDKASVSPMETRFQLR